MEMASWVPHRWTQKNVGKKTHPIRNNMMCLFWISQFWICFESVYMQLSWISQFWICFWICLYAIVLNQSILNISDLCFRTKSPTQKKNTSFWWASFGPSPAQGRSTLKNSWRWCGKCRRIAKRWSVLAWPPRDPPGEGVRNRGGNKKMERWKWMKTVKAAFFKGV